MSASPDNFAVIFDMDGLMIESEHLQSRSIETILKDHGVEPELNDAGVVQIVGITAKDNLQKLKDKHSLETPLDELLKRKNSIYSEILKQGVEPMPGLHELISGLKAKGVKTAVASSSIPEDINEVLQQLDLTDDFDSVVSAAFVKRGKPAPDVFLKAAESIGVKPSFCAVLEDAESGIKAAAAAGMKVIAVPSRYTSDNDFSRADMKVGSLEEVNFENIKKLVLG